MNSRLIAARIINEVTEGQSLTTSLNTHLSILKDPRDKALVQAICYGVCRYYTRLDVLLSYLLQKPMNAKDSDVHALILVGLYQLIYMRIPSHAAVDETVKAADKLKKSWAKNLINAVLREYLRQREKLDQDLEEDAEAKYAHPEWLLESIEAAWPKEWEQILAANNTHPPFSLRVNQQKLTREAYLKKLAANAAEMIPETQQGIIMLEAIAAEELPGFFQGEVSVQDGAAQLAAELLDLQPSMRILDACAAPGGKLTHILEIEPTAEVIAVEKDAERLVSIQENLKRLNQQATCICADAKHTQKWWDGKLFDRILLDVPCSASGVIRRHPDIKLLRQPDDLTVFAEEQLALLNQLWPLLKPNGILVYSTCSIFPVENVEVMKTFMQTHADAQEKVIESNWGLACNIGKQILPGMHSMDGFYYARLRKSEL